MKVKRKIALIDPIGSRAGLDSYDKSLVKALNEEGVGGVIYSNFYCDEFPENCHSYFSATSLPSLLRNLLLPFQFFKAINDARRRGCTSVLSHTFHFDRFDLHKFRAIKSKGLQSIVIVHDVDNFVYSTNKSNLKIICEDLADIIIVHNRFTYDELSRNIDSSTHIKIHIIPHGHFLNTNEDLISKVDARKKLKLEPVVKVALFFGMIKPNKGLDTLLRSWKNVTSNAVLVIAGRMRNSSFAQYQKIIDTDLIGADIRLLIRHISNQERNRLFSAADLIVLPYSRIYQSGVLLQALSHGVPVIASRLPAFEEIIVDGVNGLLFEPDNLKQLALQIDRLFEKEDLRNSLIKNGLETVKQNHNWNLIAKKFEPLIA